MIQTEPSRAVHPPSRSLSPSPARAPGPRRLARPLSLGIAALLLLACGCTSELETGYKPRPLSATPTQRRAYYASPFTPEAAEASHADPGGQQFHRPGAY